MYKVILKSLLVLSFSVPALAIPIKPKNKMQRPAQQQAQPRYTVASNETPTNTSQQQFVRAPRQDKWINYLMLGMNVGFEYSRIGGDGHIEVKHSTLGNRSANANSDPASALGVSFMYARLGRDALGFSAGGTITHKIDNNSGTNGSLSYGDAITLFRPEGNILFGHSSGLWGGLGAHLNWISGASDVTDAVQPFGMGLQAMVGFVPARNIALDLGYYISIHKMGDKFKDVMAAQGASVNDENSYYGFNQWRLKVSYMF